MKNFILLSIGLFLALFATVEPVAAQSNSPVPFVEYEGKPLPYLLAPQQGDTLRMLIHTPPTAGPITYIQFLAPVSITSKSGTNYKNTADLEPSDLPTNWIFIKTVSQVSSAGDPYVIPYGSRMLMDNLGNSYINVDYTGNHRPDPSNSTGFNDLQLQPDEVPRTAETACSSAAIEFAEASTDSVIYWSSSVVCKPAITKEVCMQ